MATSDSEQNERSALLRFGRKAAFMLPVLLLAPVVNYTVDPANLFAQQGEQEAKIGEALLAGKNVVNFDRYDDRSIGAYLLRHRTGHPNVLVLGSSRTLNIRGNLFPRSKFVNGSMLASTVREVMAAYAIVHGKGMHPDTVVVGLDPWMVNADAYDVRWVAIKKDFDAALELLGVKNWPSYKGPEQTQSRIGALFSADYFQQSIKSVTSGKQKPTWYTSSAEENEGFTRLPEGSYTYGLVQRNSTQAEIDEIAQKYAAEKIYMLNDNAKVDSTHVYAITRLLQMIRKDGAVPILYLPPYHPIVYARLGTDPRQKIVRDAEATLRQVASRLGIRVVGSYNPAAVGLSNADFYDGHHLRESGLAKLFSGRP